MGDRAGFYFFAILGSFAVALVIGAATPILSTITACAVMEVTVMKLTR